MLKKARAEAKAGAGGARGRRTSSKDFAQGMRESSRQIWLAGLGAFSRAQAEGMKMFETLVEQGQSLESRTKRAASRDGDGRGGHGRRRRRRRCRRWRAARGTSSSRSSRSASRARSSKLGVHTQADVEKLTRARRCACRRGQRADQGPAAARPRARSRRRARKAARTRAREHASDAVGRRRRRAKRAMQRARKSTRGASQVAGNASARDLTRSRATRGSASRPA